MNKTVIESLPSELWLILFQYFNAYELYYQFKGLNSRIDNMIELVKDLCLKIDYDNYMYYLQDIMPSINFQNIKSLTFYNKSKKDVNILFTIRK